MPLTIFPFCHLFFHFLFDLETSRMVLENNNSNCFLKLDSSGPGSLKVGTAMVDAVLLHTGAKLHFLSRYVIPRFFLFESVNFGKEVFHKCDFCGKKGFISANFVKIEFLKL